MKDEILSGYSITEFLDSDKCGSWSPETRRYYGNCLQDLLAFVQQNGEPTPKILLDWQESLRQNYGRTAVNVHIAAANNYFRWCGRYDLLFGHTKPDSGDEKETPTLTRSEYLKLLRTARSLEKQRSYLLIKLFATTDIPLQCLDQVTVELIQQGCGALKHRGKTFDFRCPAGLRRELLDYTARNGIYRGPVFITRNGQAINRVNIFRNLQEICKAAGVAEEKGNPRSLRNLYKATQKKIDERLAAFKDQLYDQLLEMEQESIGWLPEQSGDSHAVTAQQTTGTREAG